MVTLAPPPSSFDQLLQSRAFRYARCYAPEAVMSVLEDVVSTPVLALAVDDDALERSALARIDRVMLLALDALANADVHVVLVAREERARAAALQSRIARAGLLDPGDGSVVTRLRVHRPDVRVIALSDDPALITELTGRDRGIALGRPELAGENVAAIGDMAVRATLWWLLVERLRATDC
jgi:hypothetical protein